MPSQLSLLEFTSLANEAKYISVYREILADRHTPISIYEALGNENAILLESGMDDLENGYYSYIAYNPFAEIEINSNDHDNPLDYLRTQLKKYSYIDNSNINSGNVFGFATYDAIRMFENIPDRHGKDKQLPEILLNIYQNVITFDHKNQKIHISIVTSTDQNHNECYQHSINKISTVIKKLNKTPKKTASNKNSNPVDTEIDISDEQFISLVNQAKNYINEGDAFQIVLSRCFKQKFSSSPFTIYRALRKLSPSPYMFYFPLKDRVIAGASPERMLSVYDSLATLNPIAGTRKRIGDMAQDKIIETSLLSDKKEIAEHMMLVDLARNDLGSISEIDSININELLKVKHFSHVSHITSTISGKLNTERDVLDAFAATFPAGTLSGAPKIRAMEIIDELETSRRGLYGGTIFRFDNNGNYDSCIAIRMAVLKNGIATIRTGAGIVHDSDPHTEAIETKHKAEAIINAIKYADQGDI